MTHDETTAEKPVIARLYNEKITVVPDDLYIPPEALEVFLEAFEGPLDLLLYLIRKQHFNILDIPMAELTRQYLVYVEHIRLQKIELAADYLLMASVLVAIKSRLLVPRPVNTTEEAGEDPRAELVRRLLEYERMKLGAQALEEMPRLGKDFFIPEVQLPPISEAQLPSVTAEQLQQAFVQVLARAKLSTKHALSKQTLSVREHMTAILRRLSSKQFVEFYDLFDVDAGVEVVIVHFLALLELAKDTLITLTQIEVGAPIYIRLQKNVDNDDILANDADTY